MTDMMNEAKKAAEIIYNSSNDRDCQFLSLHWAIDQVIGRVMADNLATAFSVYDRLERGGWTFENQTHYTYNDLDNRAFIIRDWSDLNRVSEKAFCLMDGENNYLFRLIEDRMYNKSQMFLYYWENWAVLSGLKQRNGSRYNDIRDREYLVSSPDVVTGLIQEVNSDAISHIERALLNLNSIRWEDE